MLLNPLLFLVMYQLVLVRGQLSAECKRNSQDYAWNSVAGVLKLSYRQGTLVIGVNGFTCLQYIDEVSLRPYGLDHSTESGEVCTDLKRTLSRVLQEKGTKVSALKFVLVIGRKFYYYDDQPNGFVEVDIGRHLPSLNSQFAMGEANVSKWVKEKLAWYQNEAVELVKTSKQAPSWPSLLWASKDNAGTISFYYHYSDPRRGNGSRYKLGTTRHQIRALNLQERVFEESKSGLVFFDNYYGRVTFNLSNDRKANLKGELPVFPILPVQGLFGCPTPICWWPLIDDIAYFEGTLLVFQGRWMYSLMGNVTVDKHTQFNADRVIDLTRFHIHFVIYAAYADPNLKALMLIRHNARNEFTAVGFTLTRHEETPVARLRLSGRNVSLLIGNEKKILSAVYLKDILWLVIADTHHHRKIQFHGYLYDASTSQYTRKYIINKCPHDTLSSVFTHPGYGNLFMLSGFFLYIYKEADLYTLEESLCTVTYGHRFLNCTSKYFDLNQINIPNRPVIKSLDDYRKDARTFHIGTFLPGQCNFLPVINYRQIQFKPKMPDAVESSPESWLEGNLAWAVFAVFAGLLLTATTFFLVISLSRQKRRRNRSNSAMRQSKEKKLKQFLKRQFLWQASDSQKSSSDSSISGRANRSGELSKSRNAQQSSSLNSQSQSSRLSRSPTAPNGSPSTPKKGHKYSKRKKRGRGK